MSKLADFKIFIKRLFRAYVYGSVHIAVVGGLAFYLINFKNLYLSILIGFAIFIYYNVCRIIDVQNYNSIQNNALLQWISRNLTELILAISFSIVIVILVYFKIEESLYRSFFFIPIISLIIIYLPLRKIQYLRNLIIGFTWMFVTIFSNTTSFCDLSFTWALHLVLGFYLSIISFIYDKSKSVFLLFCIDLLILIPYIYLFSIFQSMRGLD
jgi:hypothetical protein